MKNHEKFLKKAIKLLKEVRDCPHNAISSNATAKLDQAIFDVQKCLKNKKRKYSKIEIVSNILSNFARVLRPLLTIFEILKNSSWW